MNHSATLNNTQQYLKYIVIVLLLFYSWTAKTQGLLFEPIIEDT